MTVFVLPKLNGITFDELMKMSLLEDGLATSDDIENHLALQAAVLEDMREAGATGDLARLEYLDGLYQELLELLPKLTKDWPDDYSHPGLDDPQII